MPVTPAFRMLRQEDCEFNERRRRRGGGGDNRGPMPQWKKEKRKINEQLFSR
jgi:hypothetical protein